MVDVRCTECDEPDCPGIIVCPVCGIEEHGEAAHTHIVDHGYCRECLRNWQSYCDWVEGREEYERMFLNA
jgi:hypothetical protein